MSVGEWLLIAVLTAIGSAGGGYVYGHAAGAASVEAKQDRQAVGDLTNLITSHVDLVKKSNDASAAMRRALSTRGALDSQTTKELKDALAATADSRTGCMFDAGVMQRLATARDRAAEAAAGGVLRSLPGAATSPVEP